MSSTASTAGSEQVVGGGRRGAGRPGGGGPGGGPSGVVARVVDSKTFWRVVTLVVFMAVWEWYAHAVGGLLIPTALGTVAALGGLLVSGEFWQAVWLSNQSLVLGFSIAVVLGIPLGLLMGRYRPAEKFTDVYINIMLVTPMAALIPLLIMALGFTLEARVLLVVLFAIPMVIVNGRGGVRQVSPQLIEMAQSFGASERTLWWRILLPGSLPAVMTGIRLGLGRAITAMVIIELLMIAVGLGGLIIDFRGGFQGEGLYAVVIAVVVEALLLIEVVRWLERRLVPWAHAGVLAATN